MNAKLKKIITKILEFINAVDVYVAETGTSGVWTYEKYSNGRYKAWYTGNINLQAGTSWMGGYWHNASSTAPPPAFSRSVEYYRGSPNSKVLTVFVGVDLTTGMTVWMNATAQATNNLPVHIEIAGTW